MLPAVVESDAARERRARADLVAVDVERRRGELVARDVVRDLLGLMTEAHGQSVAAILGQVRRLPAVEAVSAEARAAFLDVVESRLRVGVEEWRRGVERVADWLDTGVIRDATSAGSRDSGGRAGGAGGRPPRR